jgi:hypothetical protein
LHSRNAGAVGLLNAGMQDLTPSRARLVALAVLVAVATPLVIVALAGSGDEEGTPERPAALRVERTPGGPPEITIYIEDRSLNKPSTAGGDTSVVVECVDTEGRIVWKLPEAWPFTDTDQGSVDPHAHIGMDPAQIERIARCRLAGTDPPLAGRLL